MVENLPEKVGITIMGIIIGVAAIVFLGGLGYFFITISSSIVFKTLGWVFVIMALAVFLMVFPRISRDWKRELKK